MPSNKFLGWNRKDLEAMRTACQGARLTGIATEVVIAGVKTVYDPGRMNLNTILDEVQYAISQLEDADPTNPLDQNPYHQRPAVSRVCFR